MKQYLKILKLPVSNNMKEPTSIAKIKTELIKSCINYEPQSFIPFLMSNKVLTGMPNKARFYRFIKRMITVAKHTSAGCLTFKIEYEKNNSNKQIYFLNFYDKTHKYSRLSIEIKETKESIYLETLPF